MSTENVPLIAELIAKTGEPGQGRTNLVDLLADVMHYAEANGLDFDDAVISARNHFDAESNKAGAFGSIPSIPIAVQRPVKRTQS